MNKNFDELQELFLGSEDSSVPLFGNNAHEYVTEEVALNAINPFDIPINVDISANQSTIVERHLSQALFSEDSSQVFSPPAVVQDTSKDVVSLNPAFRNINLQTQNSDSGFSNLSVHQNVNQTQSSLGNTPPYDTQFLANQQIQRMLSSYLSNPQFTQPKAQRADRFHNLQQNAPHAYNSTEIPSSYKENDSILTALQQMGTAFSNGELQSSQQNANTQQPNQALKQARQRNLSTVRQSQLRTSTTSYPMQKSMKHNTASRLQDEIDLRSRRQAQVFLRAPQRPTTSRGKDVPDIDRGCSESVQLTENDRGGPSKSNDNNRSRSLLAKKTNSAHKQMSSAPEAANVSRNQKERSTIITFCQYALRRLKDLNEGREDVELIMQNSKLFVKNLWIEFISGKLPEEELLLRIGKYVMQNNSSGKAVNIVKEFTAWYRNKFEKRSEAKVVPKRRLRTSHPNQIQIEHMRDLSHVPMQHTRLKKAYSGSSKPEKTKRATKELDSTDLNKDNHVSIEIDKQKVMKRDRSKMPYMRSIDVSKGIDVTKHIIDVANERDKLLVRSNENQYASMNNGEMDLFLNTKALKSKIVTVLRRYRLQSSVSQDILELISHAARERISFVLESSANIAKERLDMERLKWQVEPEEENVRVLIKRMFKYEERKLSVLSDMRTVEFYEKNANYLKKQEETSTKSNDSSPESPKKKPSKLAVKLAKEREAQRLKMQFKALSDAVEGLGPKRKKGKHVPILNSSRVPISKKSEKLAAKIPEDTHQNNNQAVPMQADSSVKDDSDKTKEAGVCTVAKNIWKYSISLRDVLHFAETDHNMKHSIILYKWLARLGRPKQTRIII